jgi:hypothetical protein
MFSGLTNQPHIKPKIMDGSNLFPRYSLAANKWRKYVCIFCIHISDCHFIDREKSSFIFFLMLIVPLAVNSIPFLALRVGITQSNMSTPSYVFQNIYWSSHTHQITRFSRQNFTNYFGHSIHFFCWFPNWKSSNGVCYLLLLLAIYSADCWRKSL